MARLVKQVIKSGCRYRQTKSGLIFYGENGKSATVHFTTSDTRAIKNFTKYLIQAEILKE